MQYAQYCHNCGQKMPQMALKFCPHCGTSLSSLASLPPKEEPVVQPKQRITAKTFKPFTPRVALDDEDEDGDPYENAQGLNINMSELDVEIGPVSRNKETIGSLMAQGPNGEDVRGPTNLRTEEILDGLKREGSALRPVSKQRKNSTDVE